MANTIFQQPLLALPALPDVVPIGHQADGKGYSVTLQALGALIGGVGFGIVETTDFSPITAYNYGHYGADTLASPSVNTTAMSEMFAAMSAATPNGGEAWIQQRNYQVNFVAGGFGLPYDTVMRGFGTGGQSGGAASSYHFTANGDGILFNVAGPHTSGGVYFWGLALKNTNATLADTTCIQAYDWNTRALKCNFTNWPCAYDTSSGLSAGLEQCTLQYLQGSPDGNVSSTSPVNGCTIPPLRNVDSVYGPVMVTLAAPQCYAIGPGEFFQTSYGSHGPRYITGIGLGGSSGSATIVEHAVIRDLHISDFFWGISYAWQIDATIGAGSKSVLHGNYDFIESQSFGSCVFMMCATSGQSIFGEKYTGCTFEKSHDSNDSTSIIYLDATTNGGSNSSINDINFLNCTVYADQDTPTSNVYCYQLFSGSDIEIIGGFVGNAGSTGGANIAITGSVGRVGISNVRLNPTYPNAKNTHAGNVSQYGILISANPGNQVAITACNMVGTFGTAALAITANIGAGGSVITVDNCPMTAANAVVVTGTVASGSLYILNCLGYNDQNTSVVGNGTITTGQAYSAATAQTVLTGTAVNYYGPSLLMFTANSSGGTYAINGGTSQTLLDSQLCCIPLLSPYDTIQFATHAPTNVIWLGK